MNTPNLSNNFDLIRLLASVQVFIVHVFLIGFFRQNLFADMIWFFPGVPVFFSMSGFLLLWSLERNDDRVSYFKNRFLRLFPALWMTMILTTSILLIWRIISWRQLTDPSILMYLIGRCSVIFSFTPQVLRHFGNLNNPNGSLWTIGVELQFYLILPVIYLLIRKRSRAVKNIILVLIGLVSYMIDSKDPNLPFAVDRLNGYIQILISEIRIFYYLFFFIIGMLFYINYDRLKRWLEQRFIINFTAYCILCWLCRHYTDLSIVRIYAPDSLSLIRHIGLMVVVFSAAFSNTGLTRRLLKSNDYSYGIYLVHLLMLNACWQLHLQSPILAVSIAAAATITLAWLSWHGVEKKILKLKNHSFRQQIRRNMGSVSQATS